MPDVSLGKEITADSSGLLKWLIQTPSTTVTAVNLPTSTGAIHFGAEVLDKHIQTAGKKPQKGNTICK